LGFFSFTTALVGAGLAGDPSADFDGAGTFFFVSSLAGAAFLGSSLGFEAFSGFLAADHDNKVTLSIHSFIST